MTLVEVIVAITVFSIAIAGLYLVMQGIRRGSITAMRRSIEASYVATKLSEINPNNPAIETAYDVTTKTALSLPDGDQVWYTRIVNSAVATPDVKQINLYVYRASNASSAYRIYRKEIAPAMVGFKLGESTNYYRDILGNTYAPQASTSASYSSTTGGYTNGTNAVHSNVDGTSTCGTVSNTADQVLFQKSQESNNGSNNLVYQFVATLGRTYTIKLGATEYVSASMTVGKRKMDITLNGSTTAIGTMDAYGETGSAICKALVKTYTVQPTNDGSGLGIITVTLTQSSGATLPPRLAFISLERREY
jgi:Tfp pilus assembly protein PilV